MDGGGSIEGSGSGVSVGSGSTGVAVDEVLGDCSVGSDEVDGAADVGAGLCVGDGVAVVVGSGLGVAEADGEEILDVRWFTREQLLTSTRTGEVTLPVCGVMVLK